jgi:hypothetical protein
VELISDYLEEVLPAAERNRIEEHLAQCPGCTAYLEQMRQTIRALGRLVEGPISPERKKKLLEMFREFRQRATGGVGRDIRLGIGDEYVADGDHIAYFWETERDFEEAVGFLAVGLHRGEAGFVFGYEEANQKVLDCLEKRGFDTHQLIEMRHLHVLGGTPSGEALLANIGAAFDAVVAAGAPLIRLLGNLGWGRPNWPADDEILAFEAKVTEAARQFPCVIVCLYDVRSLPGRIILRGGFETHPLTVHQFGLRENPNYVPVDVFLNRLRGSPSLDRIQ